MADPELRMETREANLTEGDPADRPNAGGGRRLAPDPERAGTAAARRHAVPRGQFPVAAERSKPDAEMARDLDVCLILHADHTFNASTFACREVVSTRAHMYAGVAAGVGALSGSLHGGANAEVMKMLMGLRVGTGCGGMGEAAVGRDQKIMGMGHAVYKTMDPRAKFLKEMAERLGKKLGREHWFQLSTPSKQPPCRSSNSAAKPTSSPTWISTARRSTT